MGRKIFVSYKYADGDVRSLRKDDVDEIIWPTTVRDYVDVLQGMLEEDHINKGEKDEESLDGFKDATIASKLRDKIYDSSVTIVMSSPNMQDEYEAEADQWIPWEISYSLKEHSRDGRASRSNAVLVVVLPDEKGGYDHFVKVMSCCSEKCQQIQSHLQFSIIRRNMFNSNTNTPRYCRGTKIYDGYPSYIHYVKWDDFIIDVDKYIDEAVAIRDDIGNYNIYKNVE